MVLGRPPSADALKRKHSCSSASADTGMPYVEESEYGYVNSDEEKAVKRRLANREAARRMRARRAELLRSLQEAQAKVEQEVGQLQSRVVQLQYQQQQEGQKRDAILGNVAEMKRTVAALAADLGLVAELRAKWPCTAEYCMAAAPQDQEMDTSRQDVETNPKIHPQHVDTVPEHACGTEALLSTTSTNTLTHPRQQPLLATQLHAVEDLYSPEADLLHGPLDLDLLGTPADFMPEDMLLDGFSTSPFPELPEIPLTGLAAQEYMECACPMDAGQQTWGSDCITHRSAYTQVLTVSAVQEDVQDGLSCWLNNAADRHSESALAAVAKPTASQGYSCPMAMSYSNPPHHHGNAWLLPGTAANLHGPEACTAASTFLPCPATLQPAF